MLLQRLRENSRALLVALQFLTALPLPRMPDSTVRIQGLSLLWYPIAGLLIGGLLTVVCQLPTPFYLTAALVLAAWVAVTGGLHLDGLADCADAWVGGLRDRERTLALLQDPLCGSMAVIALVLTLVVKGAALAALLQQGGMGLLWIPPLLGRASLPLLFLTTGYVRPGGLGQVMADQLHRPTAWLVLVGTWLGILLLVGLLPGLVALAVSLGIFVGLRQTMLVRLQGFTGDCAGALVELTELGVLLALAAVVG